MSTFSMSDDELEILTRLSEPIVPSLRDSFLRAVAAEVEQQGAHGEGAVHRIAASLQREYITIARGPVRRYR